jgi:hypothetical protein
MSLRQLSTDYDPKPDGRLAAPFLPLPMRFCLLFEGMCVDARQHSRWTCRAKEAWLSRAKRRRDMSTDSLEITDALDRLETELHQLNGLLSVLKIVGRLTRLNRSLLRPSLKPVAIA